MQDLGQIRVLTLAQVQIPVYKNIVTPALTIVDLTPLLTPNWFLTPVTSVLTLTRGRFYHSDSDSIEHFSPESTSWQTNKKNPNTHKPKEHLRATWIKDTWRIWCQKESPPDTFCPIMQWRNCTHILKSIWKGRHYSWLYCNRAL